MMLIWFQCFSIFSPCSLKQKLEIKVEKRDESCSLNDVKSFDLINTASSMADLIDPLDLASGSKLSAPALEFLVWKGWHQVF